MRNLLVIFTFSFILFMPLSGGSAVAQQSDAERAAEKIINDLAAGDYREVWDDQVSMFFKQYVLEDTFLSNMAMVRPQLGELLRIKIFKTEHLDRDPVSGYRGDIYFVTFRNSYATGEFYEGVAVILEEDGLYRMSGFGGAPVPQ